MTKGSDHWWWQRVTALALIPLSLGFLSFLIFLSAADYFVVREWLHNPILLCFMGLFLIALLYHAILGLKVVIEDYVHKASFRIASFIALDFIGWTLGAFGIFALLRLAFT